MEVKAFVGTLILLGIHSVCNYHKAWSYSKAQGLHDIMPCQQFELIGAILHVITRSEEECSVLALHTNSRERKITSVFGVVWWEQITVTLWAVTRQAAGVTVRTFPKATQWTQVIFRSTVFMLRLLHKAFWNTTINSSSASTVLGSKRCHIHKRDLDVMQIHVQSHTCTHMMPFL